MNIFELVSIFVFPISLGSFQLAIKQGKLSGFDRIGMFRSEDFINVVFFPSLVLMVITGILVFLYSWILLIILFACTAITFPLFGRSILVHLWAVPYRIIDNWAQKKINDG